MQAEGEHDADADATHRRARRRSVEPAWLSGLKALAHDAANQQPDLGDADGREQVAAEYIERQEPARSRAWLCGQTTPRRRSTSVMSRGTRR